jgi:hypothetical protein
MLPASALARLDARLDARARWRYGALIGSSGYRLPDRASLHSAPDGSPHVRGPSAGSAAILAAEPNAILGRLTVTLHAEAAEFLLVVGPGCPVTGEITVLGPRATVILGGGPAHASPVAVTMWREDECLFVGAGTSANGLRIVLHGGGRAVVIGEDCMFANDCFLRASDMHGLLDMQSGEQHECHGDILLEPHVWLGQDVTVLKNAQIGFGAVIGAKSLVSRAIPRFTLAAGQPARVLREEVSWNRADTPDPGLHERLRVRASRLVDPGPWGVPKRLTRAEEGVSA